ncbi:sensor histidine kinase [Paenibacillus thalictri]|uniref:HAMP domain-containing protein n=1 Tax=Paenibacillus thalictri TaxID=2527873 RepID=A0A4Q9DI76_9BACL|nr:sensor histidine kinase [Paenibacillus thalictri]TBL70903.1 HAMP domain-containing protein [Paenibacillus thalictri]
MLFYRKTLSIKAKLARLILFILCVPLLIFGTLWYVKASESIERNAVDYNEQLIGQINSQLDGYFTDLERITYPLLLHPQIQSFMKLSPDEQYDRFLISKKISDELFPSITFGRPDIYGLSIVSNNGIATSSYSAAVGKGSYEQYKNAVLGDRNYRIAGIEYMDSIPVLTIARTFLDTVSYQSSGILLVYVRLSEIIKICEKIKLGDTGFIWIMDAEGRVVYHPQKDKWGKQALTPELSAKLTHENGHYVEKAGQDKRLIIYERSAKTGWTLISEVSLKELNREMISLRNITIWVGLLVVGIALIVTGGFSLYLTQSLLQLQRLMRRAEEGDLSVKAPERRNDELGALNRGFNRMVGEIGRLLEEVQTSRMKEQEMEIRQRESALQAMQSQINPHFLYNTLEIINSYAIIENVRPISRMATSLADIFRYSVGNPGQAVTLLEEIRYIRTYLEIQQERFQALQVEIVTDEAHLPKVQAVRLMIQPLVENVFKHGYQAYKQKPSYIGISGMVRDGDYILRIEDWGQGMDSGLKERYNAAIAADDREMPPQTQEVGGMFDAIGLWNVHQRIRIHFGHPYGLFIAKSDETGTMIEMRLKFVAGSLEKGAENDV